MSALILAGVALTLEFPEAGDLLTAYGAAAPAPYAEHLEEAARIRSGKPHTTVEEQAVMARAAGTRGARVGSPTVPTTRPALPRGAGPVRHHGAGRGPVARIRAWRSGSSGTSGSTRATRAGDAGAVRPRERFFALHDGMTNVVPANGAEWQAHYDAMAAKWDTAAYVGDKMVSIRHAARVGDAARGAVRLHRARHRAGRGSPGRRGRATPRIVAGGPTRTRARRWSAGTARCAASAARSGSGPTTRSWSSTTASSATRPAPASARCSRGWGSTASPEIDAAFAQVHATYVEKVAPKQRTLSPATLAFLDEHAERDVWDQVTTQLAL